MNKNFFRAVALSALLSFGAAAAFAQRSYDCPELKPEHQTMAEQVNQLNMEDPDKANSVFTKLSKKISKSKEDLVAVGTFFLDSNNLPAANMCAKQVYQVDATYLPGLMFAGEVNMKLQKWGEAGQKFDEALAVDPTNIAALKRNAFVYKNVNPIAAIDYLNQIKTADPSYTDADKELGDIYYKLDKYTEAIDAYNSYYAATPKEEGKIDIGSCENYLLALYAKSFTDTDNRDKIISIAQDLKPLAPGDILIPRMEFFAKFNKIDDAIDYDGALKAADEASAYIKNKQFADSVYMNDDYEYAAKLAKEQSDIPGAIANYELAVKYLESKFDTLDDDKKKESNKTKRGAYYYELATLYRRNKQSDECISTFNKYLSLLGDKVDNSDKYTLGQHYYAAYQQATDAAKKQEYFDAANNTFNEIASSTAENRLPIALAYMQLARLNNTDNQKPLDKVRDYYNQVIEVASEDAIKDKTQAKNARFEACRYNFFYYVSLDTPSKAEATKYATMAKEIDPENDFVTAAFEHLSTMK